MRLSATDHELYRFFRRSSRRGVFVEMAFVDMLDGDIGAALVLSQIAYWFTARRDAVSATEGTSKLSKEDLEGRRWLAKDAAGFWDETRCTERTLARHIRKFESLGVLEVKVRKHNGQRARHIALIEDVFLQLLVAAMAQPKRFHLGADA